MMIGFRAISLKICIETNRAIGGDGNRCHPLYWDEPNVAGAKCGTCRGDPCAASCEIQDRDGNTLFAIIECTAITWISDSF